MLFSIGVYRYEQFGNTRKIAAALIFISGAMLYFVGVFPDTTTISEYTMMSKLHQFFSDSPYLPMALAFLLFIYIFLKNEKFKWLIPFIVVLGPLALVAMYYYNFYPGEIPLFNQWRGVIQRIAIGLPFVVIAMIASAMYRDLE
jgi:hypothetical membrane protein|tara:strand:- start:895 stop:1326 length:432 start_codon:yes stop_codon:yes gene_type:complete